MRRAPAAAATAAGLLALTACTGDGEEIAPVSAEPAPVELRGIDLGEPLRLGVLVTLKSAPGQGQAVLPSAAGAQVAEHRLELGGSTVELDVVDDGGTVQGARDAVAELVDAGVAGIVAVTTGDHVLPALEDASAAGTAVLLPYLRSHEALPEGVWTTGPSAAAVDQELLDAMRQEEVGDPFVVTGDGVSVEGAGSADAEELTGTDTRALVRRVRAAVEAGTVDSVLVAAAPASQATVVSALQGAVPDLPVVLSPEALTAEFASTLVETGGTPAGRFVTVGVDATDATTLRKDDRGDAMASYFAALRLLAGDPNATDLFGSVPFSDVAGGADAASHDAVVALAAAAAAAGSVAPGDVLAALGQLELGPQDGLAGPALDFADSGALPEDAVVPLHATTQDPGVRPASAVDSGLFWFAVPDGGR